RGGPHARRRPLAVAGTAGRPDPRARALAIAPHRAALMRAILLAVSLLAATGASGDAPFYYRPKLRTPDVVEPFLPSLAPGGDAFPEEKEAAELAARLAELGRRLRGHPRRAVEVADLLAPTFRGGRLQPVEEVAVARHPSLQIFRGGAPAPELVSGPRPFAEELRKLVDGFREVTVAEFLITAIEVDREKGVASTDVRYDLVGPGREAWRVEQSG